MKCSSRNKRLLITGMIMVAIVSFKGGCKKREEAQPSVGAADNFPSITITEKQVMLPSSETSEVVSLEVDVDQYLAPTPKQIQKALQNAGYYKGTIDGKIGPKSKRAVIEFQIDHDLVADGKIGPQTWAALREYLDNSVQ